MDDEEKETLSKHLTSPASLDRQRIALQDSRTDKETREREEEETISSSKESDTERDLDALPLRYIVRK